ncbi:dihydrofolate reductase family protein [Spiractinospora alimapuensis]|uniref:dihydrofolate reductase family protein n=1 Tax=Spiractinospora alimapuensis TaxID=2820884 RepID=UPI001F16DCCC|nr:dihydrofolate reductase family protein [Spiractinospora alimapuensis]QVQ50553.1 dihydrofolate reductase family protein [Spiractinospora alimapuensis]
MSTLLVDYIISLDGYGAAEGWPGFWGMEGPEFLAWLADDDPAEYVHIMGATTYRLMKDFIPEATDPGSQRLNAARKLVFSSTLTEPLSWPNSELVNSDAVEVVRELKRTETKPLTTVGSISLSRSLIKAGLVDRFRVVVFPVITGITGRDRIFDHYPDLSLDLVESRTFDGQLQLLEYVPTILAGPPGTT